MARIHPRFLPARVAGAALAVASVAALALNALPATGLAAAAATPPVRTAPLHVGLVAGALPAMPQAQLNAALDDLVATGATWVRAEIEWGNVQPTSPTSYSWTNFDRVVAAANARGLNVLALIDYTPAWARQAACKTSPYCSPANPADFATFAAAAVARYAPQGVHTWEIWNEPNIGFWLPTASPTAYGALLAATAPAMRNVDPSVYIISGGLAPAATVGTNMAPRDFLSQLCATGALSNVNGIGDHPYSYPVGPTYTADWNAWSQMNATTVSLESILTACGQSAKPFWLTEYGAPTNGPGALSTSTNLNLVNHPDHVDEATQALFATQSVQSAATTPDIAAIFWYAGQDLGTSTTTIQNFFGLRRYDGTAKPAWTAFQQQIAAEKALSLVG